MDSNTLFQISSNAFPGHHEYALNYDEVIWNNKGEQLRHKNMLREETGKKKRSELANKHSKQNKSATLDGGPPLQWSVAIKVESSVIC